jgi:Tfp pilus assembly protein PilO
VSVTLGGVTPSSRAVAGIGIVAVLLLAVAGWLLVVSPKRSEASSVAERIADVESQLEIRSHQQQASSLPAGLTREQLRNVERALPDEPAVAGIVLQLSTLAAQSGVTLDTITPAPPTSGQGYVTLPLTVVVDGRFFAVRSFLRRLRTLVSVNGKSVRASGRLFDVQAVDLEQTEPAPSVRASLTVQTFVYAHGAEMETTPAAPAAASAAGFAR